MISIVNGLRNQFHNEELKKTWEPLLIKTAYSIYWFNKYLSIPVTLNCEKVLSCLQKKKHKKPHKTICVYKHYTAKYETPSWYRGFSVIQHYCPFVCPFNTGERCTEVSWNCQFLRTKHMKTSILTDLF